MDHPGRRSAWRRRMLRAARRGEAGEGPSMAQQATEGTRPEEMLAAMDVEGVDVAVAFRTWAGHVVSADDLEPRFAAALCRAYNRWLSDFCRADPARLKGAALLPQQDVALAVAEAEFAVRELGAVALVLSTHPIRGRTLDSPELDPLWQAAQELDVALAFHGTHAAYGDHLGVRYLSNLPLTHAAGQTIELILALGAMLTGGALARYPGLRCAFLEGNCSWLPWWLWALDERWEKWSDPEYTGQKERPSELFRRQCFVSVEPDEHMAARAIDEIGAECFVVSTDWPHDDSAFPHAIDGFLSLRGIDDEAKRRILWDNCARLYKLA
jgi:predicted TIM-barrel fold metal-dependent hydrolase